MLLSHTYQFHGVMPARSASDVSQSFDVGHQSTQCPASSTANAQRRLPPQYCQMRSLRLKMTLGLAGSVVSTIQAQRLQVLKRTSFVHIIIVVKVVGPTENGGPMKAGYDG